MLTTTQKTIKIKGETYQIKVGFDLIKDKAYLLSNSSLYDLERWDNAVVVTIPPHKNNEKLFTCLEVFFAIINGKLVFDYYTMYDMEDKPSIDLRDNIK